MQQNFCRTSKDFLSDEKIRVNCTTPSASFLKKRLTIDVTEDRDDFCRYQYFIVMPAERKSLPEEWNMVRGQNQHIHVILTPKIHSADESLRSLDPSQ
jgi:hypothetical protein